MRTGLQFEPLNAIIVAVEFNPRFENMDDNFLKPTDYLKDEYMKNVVMMVTKMDLFQ